MREGGVVVMHSVRVCVRAVIRWARARGRGIGSVATVVLSPGWVQRVADLCMQLYPLPAAQVRGSIEQLLRIAKITPGAPPPPGQQQHHHHQQQQGGAPAPGQQLSGSGGHSGNGRGAVGDAYGGGGGAMSGFGAPAGQRGGAAGGPQGGAGAAAPGPRGPVSYDAARREFMAGAGSEYGYGGQLEKQYEQEVGGHGYGRGGRNENRSAVHGIGCNTRAPVSCRLCLRWQVADLRSWCMRGTGPGGVYYSCFS